MGDEIDEDGELVVGEFARGAIVDGGRGELSVVVSCGREVCDCEYARAALLTLKRPAVLLLNHGEDVGQRILFQKLAGYPFGGRANGSKEVSLVEVDAGGARIEGPDEKFCVEPVYDCFGKMSWGNRAEWVAEHTGGDKEGVDHEVVLELAVDGLPFRVRRHLVVLADDELVGAGFVELPSARVKRAVGRLADEGGDGQAGDVLGLASRFTCFAGVADVLNLDARSGRGVRVERFVDERGVDSDGVGDAFVLPCFAGWGELDRVVHGEGFLFRPVTEEEEDAGFGRDDGGEEALGWVVLAGLDDSVVSLVGGHFWEFEVRVFL